MLPLIWQLTFNQRRRIRQPTLVQHFRQAPSAIQPPKHQRRIHLNTVQLAPPACSVPSPPPSCPPEPPLPHTLPHRPWTSTLTFVKRPSERARQSCSRENLNTGKVVVLVEGRKKLSYAYAITVALSIGFTEGNTLISLVFPDTSGSLYTNIFNGYGED